MWIDMSPDEFIGLVTPLLKENGFRRTRTTWRKDLGKCIAVFNVQKSQWDSDSFYVNIGTYYSKLGDEISPSVNKCHLYTKLKEMEPISLVESAIDWFQKRDAFEKAALLAEEDSNSCLVVKELRNAKFT